MATHRDTPLEVCFRTIEHIQGQCTTVQPKADGRPDFDALATALTSQSNEIMAQALWVTAGGVIIALIAIVAGIWWAVWIKLHAQAEARRMAGEWMEEHGRALIEKRMKEVVEAQQQSLVVDGGEWE